MHCYGVGMPKRLSKVPAQGRVMCRFHVSLQNVHPEIWRSFWVPSDLPLSTLHHVLQLVMGWEGGHLHEFRCQGESFAPADFEISGVERDTGEVAIAELVHKVGDGLLYIYDFGDDWRHEVRLEEIAPQAARSRPRCDGGARACPPEDCGGPPGYQHLLEVLANPEDTEFSELRQWAGDFDAERFYPDVINLLLEGTDCPPPPPGPERR